MNFPWYVKLAAAVALIAALFLAVNWYNDWQQDIGYARAMSEVTEKENADLKAALLETDRLNGVIKEAQDAAKIREHEISRLASSNATLLGRLRDTSARIDSLLSSATAEASRSAARAYGGLFADCRERFEAMGRAAAGHRSDVKTLEDAWPTK